MNDSILTTTKKLLQLAEDYDAFDTDIIMLVNSALSDLQQLGVGPEMGFSIMDKSATWSQLLGGDLRLNNVQEYVFLKVRLTFDPPQTQYLVTALQERVRELAFRINVQREKEIWIDPNPPVVDPDALIVP